MGPIVRGECKQQRDILDALVDSGKITILDDSHVSATLFLDLLQRFGLGEGETECLAACAHGNYDMACDDRRARGAFMELYGTRRITGSLALLRRCVAAGLVSSDEATGSVEQMKRRGAFLPDVGEFFFRAE